MSKAAIRKIIKDIVYGDEFDGANDWIDELVELFDEREQKYNFSLVEGQRDHLARNMGFKMDTLRHIDQLEERVASLEAASKKRYHINDFGEVVLHETKRPDREEILGQRKQVEINMMRYGGSFVVQLGNALSYAYDDNALIIHDAFEKLWDRYYRLYNSNSRKEADI